MSLCLVDIHGDIEGDYEIIGKYKPTRTGKWIDKKPNLQSPFAKMYWCDQCGAHAYKSAYCPGCGAKMEGGSE